MLPTTAYYALGWVLRSCLEFNCHWIQVPKVCQYLKL